VEGEGYAKNICLTRLSSLFSLLLVVVGKESMNRNSINFGKKSLEHIMIYTTSSNIW
jgi:hypothetical protein